MGLSVGCPRPGVPVAFQSWLAGFIYLIETELCCHRVPLPLVFRWGKMQTKIYKMHE